MAKVKPLKDEDYDALDDFQCTLDNHTFRLEHIRKCIQTVMDNQSTYITNGNKPNQINEQQCYSVLEKVCSEVISKYQNQIVTRSTNSTAPFLSKIQTTLKDQHNVLEAHHNYLKDFTIFSIGKYDDILEAIHQISQTLTTSLKTGTNANSELKPEDVKGWIAWGYNRFVRWIDVHIGWTYIKSMIKLILLFFWLITVVTSFFILRENHRLNETENKYYILRKECMKHKEMHQVIYAVEGIFLNKE